MSHRSFVPKSYTLPHTPSDGQIGIKKAKKLQIRAKSIEPGIEPQPK